MMKLQAALLCLMAIAAQSELINFEHQQNDFADDAGYDARSYRDGPEMVDFELPFAPFFLIENPVSLFLREVAMQQQQQQQQQQLEDAILALKPRMQTYADRYSEPAEQPQMLSEVASRRFEEAMSDCNKVHINMKPLGREEAAPRSSPFNSIWNSMAELDRKAEQMSLPDMDRLAQQLFFPDMISRSQQMFFFEPATEVDDVAASVTIEGGPVEHTIILLGEANNDYDAYYAPDSMVQQLAFLDWQQRMEMELEAKRGGQDMMSIPGYGIPSLADMLLLTMLLMGAGVVVANFVYNWLNLRSTMAPSEPAPPGMVQVMFEHKGQRVRGYMALADLEEGLVEGKVSTKGGNRRPAPHALKEGEVVVAADLI